MPVRNAMLDALNLANDRVFAQSDSNDLNNGMGTTLSVLIIHGNRLSIIHIGDSRIYLVRDSGIQCLTRDHTLVAKLLEDGHISRKEALEHPRKNILYQSVGVDRKVNPQIISDFKIEPGDVYIMCSDGLSNLLQEDQIRDTAAARFPREAVLELINMANRKGGDDNISVQIIKFDGHESFEQTRKIHRKSISGLTIMVILAVLFLTLLLALIIQ
jgi:protein phosphatase